MKNILQNRVSAFLHRREIGQIGANISWLVFDRFIRLGISVVVSVWMARYLGPGQFGALSYAISYMAIIASLVSFGLDTVVVRELVLDPSSKDELLGTAFIVKLLSGVVSFLAILGVSPYINFPDESTRILVTMLAASSIFQAFDVVSFWYQSKVLSKSVVLAKLIPFVVISITKIVLINNRFSVIAFGAVMVIEVALSAIFLVVAYQSSKMSIFQWRFRIQTMKSLLYLSFPMILSTLCVSLTMQADKVMLGTIAGTKTLGVYSAAVRLSEIWYFLPVVIGDSIMPFLIRAKEGGLNQFEKSLHNVYRFSSIVSLFIAISVSLLSSLLIGTIYGREYESANYVLSIHAWTSVFLFHVSIRNRVLIVQNMQKLIPVFAFFTMAINVILNYFLIPHYGAIGSALASLVSWIMAATMLPLIFKDTMRHSGMFFKSLLVFK